jgi:hypothetical protein
MWLLLTAALLRPGMGQSKAAARCGAGALARCHCIVRYVPVLSWRWWDSGASGVGLVSVSICFCCATSSNSCHRLGSWGPVFWRCRRAERCRRAFIDANKFCRNIARSSRLIRRCNVMELPLPRTIRQIGSDRPGCSSPRASMPKRPDPTVPCAITKREFRWVTTGQT